MNLPETREVGEDDDPLLVALAAAPPIEPDFGVSSLAPGTIVGGSYRIEALVGRGGMGVVYRARDLELDRRVALKLHTRRTDERHMDQLMREAKAMARLSHPNVLTVFEVGQHTLVHELSDASSTRLFIAMEYVDGGTLGEWIARNKPAWREIVDVFVQAGRGLAAAHREGLVHRDFKPDNVLLDAEGRPRVADFGVARATVGRSAGTTIEARGNTQEGPSKQTSRDTAHSAMAGTFAYMAPEQREPGAVDARADQYAFCVSLFEALVGHRPFELEDTGLPALVAIPMRKDDVRRIPASLRAPLSRGLSFDPADRFASMDDLLRALSRVLAGRGRLWLAGGSILVVATAVVLSAGGGPACDAEGELDGIWDDVRRERVVRLFAASDAPYAATSGIELVRRLDVYAQTWISQRESTCHAPREDQGIVARKRHCLERSRSELRAFVAAVMHGESAIEQAALGAGRLRSPADCDRPEVLAERTSGPLDSRTAAELDARAQELAELSARVGTGDFVGVWPQAHALMAEVGSLPASEVQLHAAQLATDVALARSAIEDARKSAQTAVEAALASGNRAALPGAAARLARVHAERMAYGEAESMLRVAEAATQGLSGPPPDPSALPLTRAYLAWRKGEHDVAQRTYELAIEMVRREHGEDTLEQVDALVGLSAVQFDRGDYDGSLATAEHGHAIVVAALGELHPLTGVFEGTRARVFDAQGRFDEAIVAARRAAAACEARVGVRAPRTLAVLENVAGTLLRAYGHGDDAAGEEAKALLERVLDDYRELGWEDTIAAGVVRTKYGQVLLQAGELDEAIVHLERGLELTQDHPVADITHRLAAWSGLGEALWHQDRHDDAVAIVGKALTLAKAERPRHVMTARIMLQYGLRLFGAERYREARDALHEVIELGEDIAPRSMFVARAWSQIGRASLMLDEPDVALEALAKAEALARAENHPYPSLPGLLFLEATAHHQRGDVEQTRATVEQALEIWPEDGEASYGSRAKLGALLE